MTDDGRATKVIHSREQDIQTVATFITGWWPGLEDALPWGNDLDEHPVIQAALRLTKGLYT